MSARAPGRPAGEYYYQNWREQAFVWSWVASGVFVWEETWSTWPETVTQRRRSLTRSPLDVPWVLRCLSCVSCVCSGPSGGPVQSGTFCCFIQLCSPVMWPLPVTLLHRAVFQGIRKPFSIPGASLQVRKFCGLVWISLIPTENWVCQSLHTCQHK